ncbi:hypothetical protein GW17_00045481 [Ensete ventricosum]|nr:hypothetical protein GW17_00045481 [Ensete ventricosum]
MHSAYRSVYNIYYIKQCRLVPRGETRRHLVPVRGEEASPRPAQGGEVSPHPAQGDEASPHPAQGDEASPHPCVGRLVLMVSPSSGRSAYRYPVRPVCTARIG